MKYKNITKTIAISKLHKHNKLYPTTIGKLTLKHLKKRTIKLVGFCDVNEKEIRYLLEDNTTSLRYLKTKLRKEYDGFIINKKIFINEKFIENEIKLLKIIVHEMIHIINDLDNTKDLIKDEFLAYSAEYKFENRTDELDINMVNKIKNHICENYNVSQAKMKAFIDAIHILT